MTDQSPGNPYQPPNDHGTGAASRIVGAATGLLIASVIGILFALLGIAYMLRLAAGEPGNQVLANGVVYFGANALWCAALTYGAIEMRRCRSYESARATAWLATVPFLGPCYLLGVPFGIWALTRLRDPAVVDLFSDTKAPRKERHGCLTAYLAAVLSFTVSTLLFVVVAIAVGQGVFSPLVLLIGVIQSIGVAAIWFWKRWGFYLFVAAAFANGAVGLAMNNSAQPLVGAVVSVLILLGVLQIGGARKGWTQLE